MVRRETPEKKKKVQLFPWEKQEHSSRTKSPRAPLPPPQFFLSLEKIAERAFASDSAGCLWN